MSEVERLRDKVMKCRQLALLAGDVEIKRRLVALADEFEAKAVRASAQVNIGRGCSGRIFSKMAREDLLGEINVLPFEVPADTKYGVIRAELEAAGKPIRGNDLLIAAHAYATGAAIVTANTCEFKRIRRGLNVENWLA